MKPPTELSDEKLIQYYLNNNPAELTTLAELYKDRIYSSIFLMVQDKYVAEEIFRDVFITIINNMMAGKVPVDGNFLQWAIQIARQLCIEYARKESMAIPGGSADKNTGKEVEIFKQVAVSPAATYHESHNKIKGMINLLPDQQREVIALNHYAGLGFKDIADIMKCSVTTALDIMKVGLNNLKKLMIEKEIALR